VTVIKKESRNSTDRIIKNSRGLTLSGENPGGTRASSERVRKDTLSAQELAKELGIRVRNLRRIKRKLSIRKKKTEKEAKKESEKEVKEKDAKEKTSDKKSERS